ncbi:MAG: sulfotransferase family protein [Actinomycetota bacterium]
MSNRPPFPFIVACGRSGTTMLRVMFEQHPDMAIPPESYFPVSFWRRRERYRVGGGFDLGAMAEDLVRHDRFLAWRLDQTVVRERLAGTAPDFAEAVRRVYALYAEAHGKTRYGDKTPPFLMHLPLLAREFPEARFVHLVRDGRDVVLSLREQRFAPSSFAGAAEYWASRVRRGRGAGQRLGPDRYREVRYEDLVADPERELRRLCEFVELDFRPEMLAYRQEDLARIPLTERMKAGGAASAPGPSGRDWRSQMTPRQLAVVEVVAGDELEALGYERAASPTLPARAIASVVRVWRRTGGKAASRLATRRRAASAR